MKSGCPVRGSSLALLNPESSPPIFLDRAKAPAGCEDLQALPLGVRAGGAPVWGGTGGLTVGPGVPATSPQPRSRHSGKPCRPLHSLASFRFRSSQAPRFQNLRKTQKKPQQPQGGRAGAERGHTASGRWSEARVWGDCSVLRPRSGSGWQAQLGGAAWRKGRGVPGALGPLVKGGAAGGPPVLTGSRATPRPPGRAWRGRPGGPARPRGVLVGAAGSSLGTEGGEARPSTPGACAGKERLAPGTVRGMQGFVFPGAQKCCVSGTWVSGSAHLFPRPLFHFGGDLPPGLPLSGSS